jgi:hypothetical protein
MIPMEQLIEHVRERPPMFLLDGSFRDYVVYFAGVDMASHVLDGFSEWIATTRLDGHGANLIWPVLVIRVAGIEPTSSGYWRDLAPEDDALATDTFFELLTGLLAERARPGND